jgi:DNA-binding GntR family transcriptional regulator
MPVQAAATSLEEHVYRELRDMVMRGDLVSGQKLVQEELAAKLGVSRTPLRSAIANLERDNFVRLTPRGEAYVLEFGPQRIADIFEIRAVLEGLTCRLVAPTIERKHIMYLRSLMSSVQTTGDAESLAAYRAADVEFHTVLTGLLDDPFLTRMLETMQIIMTMSLAQGLLRSPAETLPEHLAIIDALEAHDPDTAERAMLLHIRKTISLMKTMT